MSRTGLFRSKRMSTLMLVISLVVLLLPVVPGYPQGPPVDDEHPNMCKDMIPTGHGVDAMTTGQPFQVVVAGSCYKSGVPLPVFVRVNKSNNTEPYHEGIFVMARNYASQTINREDNVGTFDVMSDPELKTLPCFGKQDSAVGQAKEGHYDCKRFNWIPPESMTDDIIFHATIVRNKERFWKDVLSTTISYDQNCSPDATTVECVVLDENSNEDEDDDDDDEDKSMDTDKDSISGADVLTSFYTWITCLLTALLSL